MHFYVDRSEITKTFKLFGFRSSSPPSNSTRSMVTVALTSPPLASNPCCLRKLRPIHTRYNQLKKLNQRRSREGKCRAELSADAPVAFAIGACILNSYIFPVATPPEDDDSEALIDSTDTRFAVMGIISFIPYFNWMSWVFAWLDSGKRRYAVYAVVYLAPYLRSNLSISPEDSWLPIASILLCIAHIQLEAGIKNGDIQGFPLFSNASSIRKKSSTSEQRKGRKDSRELPSAEIHGRNEVDDWGAQKDREILHGDEEGPTEM